MCRAWRGDCLKSFSWVPGHLLADLSDIICVSRYLIFRSLKKQFRVNLNDFIYSKISSVDITHVNAFFHTCDDFKELYITRGPGTSIICLCLTTSHVRLMANGSVANVTINLDFDIWRSELLRLDVFKYMYLNTYLLETYICVLQMPGPKCLSFLCYEQWFQHCRSHSRKVHKNDAKWLSERCRLKTALHIVTVDIWHQGHIVCEFQNK